VRREVSILHHLNGHPNIVGLKAAYEGSKHVYIVMELCTGGRGRGRGRGLGQGRGFNVNNLYHC